MNQKKKKMHQSQKTNKRTYANTSIMSYVSILIINL